MTPEAQNARAFAAKIAKLATTPKVNALPAAGYFFIRDTVNGKLYAEGEKWTTEKARAAKYSPRVYAEEVAAMIGAENLEIIEAD